MRNQAILLLFVILIISSSCLNRQYEDGWVEPGAVSDTALNDSCLIYGHIYNVGWEDKPVYSPTEFEVWVENPYFKTSNDISGNYYIKLMPGTYTITCQSTGNEWERLVEQIKDLKIEANKKTRIDFYIGTTIE